VLPILLVVFAAIVDFGFLFQRYEVVTNAAREGARVGVLPGYIQPPCPPSLPPAPQPDVEARVKQYLAVAGLDDTLASVFVLCPSLSVGSGGQTIATVSVVVEYPSAFTVLGPIAGLVGGTGWSSLTLRAGSTMRMEVAATGS